MAAKNHPVDGEPSHIARTAIEQLLNRQEDDASEAAYERRAARRLCGRWLLMRRMLRGLSRADVARRVRIDEEALALLELGLTDAPLTADDVWLRLALVLEGAANDFEQVGAVIAGARGQTPVTDPAWLELLEAELAQAAVPTFSAEPVDLAQADLPPETLQAADQLIHERINDIPPHSVYALRALRRAPHQTLTVVALKIAIEEHERLDLGIVELRKLLERLEVRGLVQSGADTPTAYQITPAGSEALLVALRNTQVEQLRDEAVSDLNRVVTRLLGAQGSV
jgi:transcriptional regulator with XRE-family HTH domain